MPDWSYHPMFKPLLFLLPPRVARKVTLSAVGMLGKMPAGGQVLELFGHMRTAEPLRKTLFGVEFASPVGLSGMVDPELDATGSLSRFGFGFVAIGPVGDRGESAGQRTGIYQDRAGEAILYESRMQGKGLDEVVGRLKTLRGVQAPLALHVTGEQMASAIERTNGDVQFYIVEGSVEEYLGLKEQYREIPMLFYVNGMSDEKIADVMRLFGVPDRSELSGAIGKNDRAGVSEQERFAKLDGVYLDEAEPVEGGFRFGREAKETTIRRVHELKALAPELPIVAGGGIYEPQDALDVLEAGADLLVVHSGFVYSGPGLPKRINEAILDEMAKKEQRLASQVSVQALAQATPSATSRIGWVSWLLMGLGVIFAGLLALYFGLTDVILGYDEKFLGIQKEAIMAWNHRLYHFMSHDRITLAGIMVSAGFLYAQLAYHKIRFGIHWATTIFTVAAVYGFLNFFYFLFFGYFDVLHLVYNLALVPFFLVGYFRTRKRNTPLVSSNRHNTPEWKRAQVGQLMFVMLGGALLSAGIVISVVGMTYVFVPQDLAFFQLTPEQINAFNSQLIPLIAHDRAGFGGALISEGLLLMLISLWGYREGEKWLWWSYLIGGAVGLAGGVGVHFMIHYTDWFHLLPAYVAGLLYVLGLVFSYRYLCEVQSRRG
ncbi:MAG: dihydroorotate dehydrogenase [Tumebacillaceae bacterium]